MVRLASPGPPNSAQQETLALLRSVCEHSDWSHEHYVSALKCFEHLATLQYGNDWDHNLGIYETVRLGQPHLAAAFCIRNSGLEWWRATADALIEVGSNPANRSAAEEMVRRGRGSERDIARRALNTLAPSAAAKQGGGCFGLVCLSAVIMAVVSRILVIGWP
jgi:hypothetical protein